MNKELEIKHLVHKQEKIYFVLALIVSILGYVALLTSIIGLIPLLILTTIPAFYYALMIATIRTNGVRITNQQFSNIYEKIAELCDVMEISKTPDVFVIESSGVLNAFAIRFFGKNMVILYSEIFDLIDSRDEEILTFIIAHELAHIKRNHSFKRALLLPAMWIPFLSEAYSRSCEYTCDRMAAYYSNNSEAAMNGLTMLGIGKTLFRKVNREDYLLQCCQEKGFYTWLSENLSTHPPLPKRIDAIQAFSDKASNPVFGKSNGIKWAIVVCLLVMFSLTGVGYLYTDDIMYTANSFFLEDSSSEEYVSLIQAVADGDMAEVRRQLESGIDPDLQGVDGWTPLMWAAQDNNIEMIDLFINAGAQPDFQDFYEGTALLQAVTENQTDAIAALINGGADPNLADSFGWTPLMSAASLGNIAMSRGRFN